MGTTTFRHAAYGIKVKDVALCNLNGKGDTSTSALAMARLVETPQVANAIEENPVLKSRIKNSIVESGIITSNLRNEEEI